MISYNLPRRRLQGPRHGQGGFTLVELVTVILILGVLAAVALPRYADLQGKARAAKVKAVAGSMKAAAGLVKAAAMANSSSCTAATGTSPPMEGTSIATNYCYPQALPSFTDGILAAANVPATGDNWAVDGTIAGGAAGGTGLLVELTDAATPANCGVTYTSATSAAPATTTVDVSAC